MRNLLILAIPLTMAATIGCKSTMDNSDVSASFGETRQADGTPWTCSELKEEVADSRGISQKEIRCQERKNDAVAAFFLDKESSLWRAFFNRKNKTDKPLVCLVANAVIDFKVSKSPADPAELYFSKNALDRDGYPRPHLYSVEYVDPVLGDDGQYFSKCPESNIELAFPKPIEKYDTLFQKKSPITSVRLGEGGEDTGWKSYLEVWVGKKVNRIYGGAFGGVADFWISPCYAVEGREYNKYPIFYSVDYRPGNVSKVQIGHVNGDGSEGREYNKYPSKVEPGEYGDGSIPGLSPPGAYESLDDFIKKENVCKKTEF
jgi:hypothetical protein